MYHSPRVESSYKANDLGKSIYQTVIKLKPIFIIDFGILHGYSTIAMAQALRDLGQGTIIGYDLFEDYQGNHAVFSQVQKNIKDHGLQDIVNLKRQDYYQWLKNPENFDLIHIDISNNGDIIQLALRSLSKQLKRGATILFEGGTKERDQVDWMKNYNKPTIYPSKKKLGYTIIDPRFPGLSMIKG